MNEQRVTREPVEIKFEGEGIVNGEISASALATALHSAVNLVRLS